LAGAQPRNATGSPSNAYFMVPHNYPVQCRDGEPLPGLRTKVYRLDPVAPVAANS